MSLFLTCKTNTLFIIIIHFQWLDIKSSSEYQNCYFLFFSELWRKGTDLFSLYVTYFYGISLSGCRKKTPDNSVVFCSLCSNVYSYLYILIFIVNPKKFKKLDHFLDFFQIPKISEFKVSSNGSQYSEIITGNRNVFVNHRLQNNLKYITIYLSEVTK